MNLFLFHGTDTPSEGEVPDCKRFTLVELTDGLYIWRLLPEPQPTPVKLELYNRTLKEAEAIYRVTRNELVKMTNAEVVAALEGVDEEGNYPVGIIPRRNAYTCGKDELYGELNKRIYETKQAFNEHWGKAPL